MHGCNEVADPVARLLHYLSEEVYFADALAYDDLLRMAVTRLRRIWDASIARNMLGNVARDFAGMRDMLKRKDPNIKVTSYAELDGIDVSRFFTVDDFLTEEQLLLNFGLESRNFRRADALKAFTDGEQRLKATSTIARCQVSFGRNQGGSVLMLTYQCAVERGQVRWLPSMTDNRSQKDHAQKIARRWGKGTGRYCFTTSLQDMEQILSDPDSRLSFPDLRYCGERQPDTDAAAQVRQTALGTFSTGFRIRADSSNEAIKDLLRAYGRPMTGKKEDLVQRLVELLAQQYVMKQSEMDEFFSKHRFIRLTHERSEAQRWPVLQNDPLAGHLLTMYCLRHMRGNVVLETQHENNSVRLPDLADAILAGRVKLSGCFVPVE